MFESIKIKKAAKDFQNKYNLSSDEMSYIYFMKSPISNNYIAAINPNVHNPQLYRKINQLNSLLENKLNQAKNKFSDITNMFQKEETFDTYKDECYEELENFLYLFQYNSSKVRISYSAGTSVDIMQQVWNKADIYLDAICLFYLLSLQNELVGYSKTHVFSMLKHILQKEQDLFNRQYEDIYKIVMEKIKLMSRIDKGYFNDWNEASIIK